MLLPELSFLRVETHGDVIIDVHVIPHAARTQASGLHDGALRVRVHAPPVDGKANLALMAWLATVLQVAKRHIHLVRGPTSQRKQFRVSAAVSDQANWLALRDQAMDRPSTL